MQRSNSPSQIRPYQEQLNSQREYDARKEKLQNLLNNDSRSIQNSNNTGSIDDILTNFHTQKSQFNSKLMKLKNKLDKLNVSPS